MREKLIETAIEKFGSRGFDAVGTREIAAEVGTPMSSIAYHFGGKEGLYLAAAEHIFAYLQNELGGLVDDTLPDNATAEERLASICSTLRRIGQFMLSDESAPFALFIGREQQNPTQGVLDLMREQMLPMIDGLATQVGTLRPDLSVEEAKANTVFLFGMAVTLRTSRASLRLLMECDDFDAQTQEMLLDQIEKAARAILLEARQ